MIKIELTKRGVLGISKSELRNVGRAAILVATTYWWRNFLPIHFTKKGARRYNYRVRDGELSLKKNSYTWRKLHRKTIGGVASIGEVKPLVWSGRSRDAALSSKNITGIAKSHNVFRGRAVLNARAINFVESGPDELTRTTPAEERKLSEVFLEEFERQLNARGRTRLAAA